MKIAVAVPSGDFIHTDFLSHIFALFSSERAKQLCYINTRSSMIQQGRYMLVEAAQAAGADKILMIDSDHTFPPDGLNRLIEHDKAIVAATYSRRREPYGILGYDIDGHPIQASARGLEKVALLPLGFALIDMEVFHKVDRPWFCVGFDPVKKCWAGEDYGFCTGARQAGYDIWCDFDLSREIGHLGLKVFTWPEQEEESFPAPY